MAEVKARFRPEFLNRLDEIILFRRLGREQMTAIVDMQLRRIADLLADRNITIDADERAREWLAEAGVDPVYGARRSSACCSAKLQNPLAELILKGDVADGVAVRVTATDGGLVIEPEATLIEAA